MLCNTVPKGGRARHATLPEEPRGHRERKVQSHDHLPIAIRLFDEQIADRRAVSPTFQAPQLPVDDFGKPDLLFCSHQRPRPVDRHNTQGHLRDSAASRVTVSMARYTAPPDWIVDCMRLTRSTRNVGKSGTRSGRNLPVRVASERYGSRPSYTASRVERSASSRIRASVRCAANGRFSVGYPRGAIADSTRAASPVSASVAPRIPTQTTRRL